MPRCAVSIGKGSSAVKSEIEKYQWVSPFVEYLQQWGKFVNGDSLPEVRSMGVEAFFFICTFPNLGEMLTLTLLITAQVSAAIALHL